MEYILVEIVGNIKNNMNSLYELIGRYVCVKV